MVNMSTGLIVPLIHGSSMPRSYHLNASCPTSHAKIARTVCVLGLWCLRCEFDPRDRHGYATLHFSEQTAEKCCKNIASAVKRHHQICLPILLLLSSRNVTLSRVLGGHHYDCSAR